MTSNAAAAPRELDVIPRPYLITVFGEDPEAVADMTAGLVSHLCAEGLRAELARYRAGGRKAVSTVGGLSLCDIIEWPPEKGTDHDCSYAVAFGHLAALGMLIALVSDDYNANP